MSKFREQVEDIVHKMSPDDNGNYTLPDDIKDKVDPDVLYAATLAKRQKDSQASYTKSQKALRAATETAAKLAERWEQDSLNNLSPSDVAKLEELKVQDPDEYIKQVTTLKDTKKSYIKEELDKISQEADKMSELEKRKIQLDFFNRENTDFVITDKLLAEEVPPRITNKLRDGKIDFAEFLIEVKTYLGKSKAIDKGATPPNLGGMQRGSSAPSRADVAKQNSVDYSKTLF